jgi:hypothetical protein
LSPRQTSADQQNDTNGKQRHWFHKASQITK